MTSKEWDSIKAELIRMRKYVIHHGVPIGECVAWSKLKAMFEVGIIGENDDKWLSEYDEYEQGNEAK